MSVGELRLNVSFTSPFTAVSIDPHYSLLPQCIKLCSSFPTALASLLLVQYTANTQTHSSSYQAYHPQRLNCHQAHHLHRPPFCHHHHRLLAETALRIIALHIITQTDGWSCICMNHETRSLIDPSPRELRLSACFLLPLRTNLDSSRSCWQRGKCDDSNNGKIVDLFPAHHQMFRLQHGDRDICNERPHLCQT